MSTRRQTKLVFCCDTLMSSVTKAQDFSFFNEQEKVPKRMLESSLACLTSSKTQLGIFSVQIARKKCLKRMLRWSFSVYELELDQKRGAQSIVCIYLTSANDEKLGDVYIV